MTRQCHQSVVVLGTDRHDVGPQLAQYTVQHAVGLGTRRVGGGEDPVATLEQVRLGPAQATQLGSRHRVAPEESRVRHFAHDRTLHPGDVGENERGIGKVLAQRVSDLAHHPRGRRHEDDLVLVAQRRALDDALTEGQCQDVSVSVVAGYRPTALAKGERQRGADEPEAHDVRSATRRGGHHEATAPCAGRYGGSLHETGSCTRAS